ncbi:MAG: CxxC-x17-CxxC domain-containing protein [bacterium]
MFNKTRSSGGGYKGGGKKFGGHGGGGGGYKGGFGGGDRERPAMHQATCSKCNSSCEVPFKPNGSKPVLCSNCFKRDDNGGRSDRFEKRSYSPDPTRSNDNIGAQLKQINDKLDALIEAMTEGEDGEEE